VNGRGENAAPIILLVLGAVVLRLALVGDFVNFVKPGHRPWLLAVGLALVIFGIIGFIHDLRHEHDEPTTPVVEREPHTHGPLAAAREVIEAHRREHEPVHDHSRIPAVSWLLLLPILLVFLVPPPALGAFAASRGSAAVPQPPTNARFEPLGPSNPATLQVYDYAERATWDNGRTLTGRTVVLTGFATPRPDGGWYLSRLRISCCAADARAYLVYAVGAKKDYPANAWMQVTGTFIPPQPGTHIARIAVIQVRGIHPPTEPYEQ
jgi:uncharacterized repeat protein (TIGR03943 family)